MKALTIGLIHTHCVDQWCFCRCSVVDIYILLFVSESFRCSPSFFHYSFIDNLLIICPMSTLSCASFVYLYSEHQGLLILRCTFIVGIVVFALSLCASFIYLVPLLASPVFSSFLSASISSSLFVQYSSIHRYSVQRSPLMALLSMAQMMANTESFTTGSSIPTANTLLYSNLRRSLGLKESGGREATLHVQGPSLHHGAEPLACPAIIWRQAGDKTHPIVLLRPPPQSLEPCLLAMGCANSNALLPHPSPPLLHHHHPPPESDSHVQSREDRGAGARARGWRGEGRIVEYMRL